MKSAPTFLWLILFISIVSCKTERKEMTLDNKAVKANEVTFYSSDSVIVYADLYLSDSANKTIVLGHQGGSNARAEYKRIIPELIKMQHNVLAVDFRKGGQLYGSSNRTISQLELDNFNYCDAYIDLVAAIDFLDSLKLKTPKILWGSSFSAALVLKYAAENKREDILGILAFSPASGEPMGNCNPNLVLDQIEYPTLILRPLSETKIPSVINQLSLATQNGLKTYVAEHGVHGSSMLDSTRVKSSVSDNWNAVTSFIKQLSAN